MQVGLPSLFLALTFTHLTLPCWLLSFTFKRRTHEECINHVIWCRFCCLSPVLSHFACLGPTCLSSSFQHMFVSLVLTLLFLSHSRSDLCSSFSSIFLFCLQRNIYRKYIHLFIIWYRLQCSFLSLSVSLSLSLSLSLLGELEEDTSTVMLFEWWHVYRYQEVR